MKKILLSVGIIAIVAVGAIGATRAYFSSTATMSGNTFTAGTLDLQLDDTISGGVENWVNSFNITSDDFKNHNGYGTSSDYYTAFITNSGFNNLFPGAVKTQIIDIKNNGSIAGIPNIKFDASNDTGLYNYTSVSVKYYNGSETPVLVAEGPLSAWNNGVARSAVATLAPQGIGHFEITLTVSPELTTQGAQFGLVTTFGLNQVQ